jgi:hypothetical protein
LHWSLPHLRSRPSHHHYPLHAVTSVSARRPCPTPSGPVQTTQVSDEHVRQPHQLPTLVPHSRRAIRRTTSFTLDCNQHSIASDCCCKRTNLAIPANRARDCIASARAEPQQRESTMREHESRKKRKNWTSPFVCVQHGPHGCASRCRQLHSHHRASQGYSWFPGRPEEQRHRLVRYCC